MKGAIDAASLNYLTGVLDDDFPPADAPAHPPTSCPPGASCNYGSTGSFPIDTLSFIILTIVLALAMLVITLLLMKRQKRRKLKETRAVFEKELIRLNDALRTAEMALSEASAGSVDYQRAKRKKKRIEKEMADLRHYLEQLDRAG